MIRPNTSGFIALMSAIIISAILLIVATTGSLTGFYTRSNILDSESKDRSAALADACMDTVLLRLSYDATYGGGEIIPLGSDSCEILVALNPFSNPRTFPIQAIFNQAYTNALVTMDVVIQTVTSWQEVSNF